MPLQMYGKSFVDLDIDQQTRLLGYESLRNYEMAAQWDSSGNK